MRNNAKALREKHGLTQEQVAEALGMHYTSVNRMENKPTLAPKWVKRLARLFNEPESAFVSDAVAPAAGATSELPVYGLAAGSMSGAFTMSNEVVDWVRRPPGLSGARDCYALFVSGNSMEPRFFEGDIIYIAPHSPVRKGDVVVVQQRDADVDGMQTWLKVFDRKDDRFVYAIQYNPPGEVRFDNKTVISMHRVMKVNELFGL